MRPVRSRAGLIQAYRQHLLTTCGVTEGTCELFVWHVSKFLTARYKGGTINLGALKPPDLIKYVSNLASHYMPNTRKSAVSALRSFLRWLLLTGECAADLAAAVPTVSSRKQSELPAHLSAAEIDDLLRKFDRSTPRGQRGYAAALCMARLGMRVGEVARLTLEDIDWRAGTLRIARSKNRRSNTLPLSRDVGQAIVEYLRNARALSTSRHIFGRIRPPRDRPAGRNALRADIRAAFQRAGFENRLSGTRVLRHTAATHLIQRGVPIKGIADVLGHRSIDTTAIYAKVDLPVLREVALPWPEVTP